MQTARVQWVGKERFVALSPSGHMVALDSDRSANTAPGAMELLLVALGACTATDVVSILAKMRQRLDSLEVEVSGERAEEPPRVWTKLEIVFKLRGVLDQDAAHRAVQLSEEKYCSVAATLRKTASLSYRVEIESA
jgi:putative redox protein